ncbi:MAG: isochorismatase family protein [Planctomycetes bacterium]|nr:isochorismatase family protein [Planctomycetota bacterium]
MCLVPWANAGEKDLSLTIRKRGLAKLNGKEIQIVNNLKVKWSPKQSAVIVVDMWDTHHCYNAVTRVVEMAPRMNKVLEKCRSMGMTIIHAPSSCMDAYKDHPGRKRAKDAPTAKNLPKDIGVWCHMIPAEEKGKYPLDASDGGCDSDPVDQAKHRAALIKMGRNPNAPWKSQYAVLKMHDIDLVSDSGVEIWNLLESRKINNVIILGVHTNMCVLGRPFGLRQMAKNGKNVVLMRDMTDTMYNPKKSPYVNHYKGTALIVEHIEKYVCPTITSDQIIGGKAFRFKADTN